MPKKAEREVIAFRRKQGAARRGTVEYMQAVEQPDGTYKMERDGTVLTSKFVKENYAELSRIKFSDEEE